MSIMSTKDTSYYTFIVEKKDHGYFIVKSKQDS